MSHRPTPPSSSSIPYGSATTSALENQNNDRISSLSSQVSQLKNLTLNINSEVSAQNALLNGMDDDFSGLGGLLGTSVNRIKHMMDRTGGRHMWYMAGFIVLVMTFLYWTMKRKY
eukprot:CAMPEP_0182487026 /NCGR_PEP_ID=MMETSP1319-20130603/47694_1 /TAXON_ID=172717 /ORGANISM="Bolidomonas pacifica, Strain RCC208" /LENGTH=114 /DNA_ID=CAMNT_0024689135 /DNA_START=512 /DNA_END=856 /DNA_ORIENTATION=-